MVRILIVLAIYAMPTSIYVTVKNTFYIGACGLLDNTSLLACFIFYKHISY